MSQHDYSDFLNIDFFAYSSLYAGKNVPSHDFSLRKMFQNIFPLAFMKIGDRLMFSQTLETTRTCSRHNSIELEATRTCTVHD